ncbi:MAG: ABC-F family ATP-binding cassette domain-containing protein [Massiliimalia sp.]
MLLSAEKISKSYTLKPLLTQVSLFLNQGDKVGVVGVNGTGKSTFLKILAGQEVPDEGTVTLSGGAVVSYLPQNPDFSQHRSVLEQVLAGCGTNAYEGKEYEAKSILNQLGITDFSQDVTCLSGGQKKRVAIAAALLTPCQILILDEPTNHIDNAMVQWLENYLQSYKGAVVMVTHDRYFLDRVTNRIVELDKGALYSYDCNYTGFLERKAQREEMEAASQRKRQALLRTELQWVQRGPRARGTKSRYRLERYEELKNQPGVTEQSTLELSSISSRLGKKIVEAKGIQKSYGTETIIRDFDFLLLRDARIGIIGPNGCGKSTLLKILAGEIVPDQGTVSVGETVRFGYFSQEWEKMDPQQKVIDYVRDHGEYVQTTEGTVTASQMLERFLFPPDLQWNTIGRLSGGEQRRLYLLGVLMKAPNVLLLDEPTNDLDIQTLMILEEYLEHFSGAVIAVSHDRYFLDKIAQKILAFEGNGEIREYLGGYTDYYEEHEQIQLTKEREKKEKKATSGKERTAKRLKFSFKDQYDWDHIEDEMAQLEEKIQKVEEEIELQSANFEKLQSLLSEKEELEGLLEQKMERWVELSDLAEKIKAQE